MDFGVYTSSPICVHPMCILHLYDVNPSFSKQAFIEKRIGAIFFLPVCEVTFRVSHRSYPVLFSR